MGFLGTVAGIAVGHVAKRFLSKRSPCLRRLRESSRGAAA